MIYHPHATIIAAIRSLIHTNWNLTLNQTLRQGNTVANYLAKEGAKSIAQFSSLHACPAGLYHSVAVLLHMQGEQCSLGKSLLFGFSCLCFLMLFYS